MLSILIPIYNYNAYPLVKELQKQCIETKIDFEILCQDDFSTDYLQENQEINTLENCRFSRNETNLGRGKNINTIATQATKEYLVIVDCDTFPKNTEYIRNYVQYIREGRAGVLYGGIIYESSRPGKENLLRWIYGIKREALSLDLRNKKPHSSALTSNLLIKKEIFAEYPFDITITNYGYEDLCFLMVLESYGFTINHCDNPTFHLNLETSELFLKKTKIALENLAFIFESKKHIQIQSKIVSAYIILNKTGLIKLAAGSFRKTETLLKNNLLSTKPSLLAFDLFKLGYFCHLQNQKSIARH
jgi:glycosyltransferase involved in cell wall biosynthesis